MTNHFTKLGVMAGLIFTLLQPARAAELLMLEQEGCEWCERWHAEIGPIYPKTDESKLAPLRLVDIHEEWPDDLANVRKEHFTPTFVLVDNGLEYGRIRGYPGDEFFWGLLAEMIKKLPATSDANDRPNG